MAMFRRSQIHTRNDPTFGAIQFERGLWASLPNPTAGWSVIIEAPPNGPSDEQRAFFRLLKEDNGEQARPLNFANTRVRRGIHIHPILL